MTKTIKQVGPQRYRETFGRYFGEFTVGDVYEHRPGKTVTEYDNHMFTLLTLNTHPLHFDAEFGKATEFGRNLVVSTYTLSLLIGMSVTDISQKAIANLGMDEVKFTAPVFVGDTLFAGSVGRTDLPGGNHDILMRSITGVLFTLGDAATLHPGHGPDTTIGHERRTNPFVLEYLSRNPRTT